MTILFKMTTASEGGFDFFGYVSCIEIFTPVYSLKVEGDPDMELPMNASIMGKYYLALSTLILHKKTFETKDPKTSSKIQLWYVSKELRLRITNGKNDEIIIDRALTEPETLELKTAVSELFELHHKRLDGGIESIKETLAEHENALAESITIMEKLME